MAMHPGIKGDRNEKQRWMTHMLFDTALLCSFRIFPMTASSKELKLKFAYLYMT